MPTVRLRVTTFNVEDMPAHVRPGFLWDAFIQESILMHRSGNQRTGRELTEAQRDRIRDTGREWFH